MINLDSEHPNALHAVEGEGKAVSAAEMIPGLHPMMTPENSHRPLPSLER